MIVTHSAGKGALKPGPAPVECRRVAWWRGGSHQISGVENISGSGILYLTLGNGEKESVT